MSSKIFSTAVVGLEAEIVEVEAEMGGGQMGTFTIVGLPDIAVSESRERVRSAIKNSGLEFPRIKTTVNLAPADLRKQGPSYDLPIAISVLIAAHKINPILDFSKFIFIGELALSGEVRPVSGVLSAAICAQTKDFTTIFVPLANASEAALVPQLDVRPVRYLREVIDHLIGKAKISALVGDKIVLKNELPAVDFSEVRGQEHVKRALEIAAAGAHNVLMTGPPGSGKTLLARSLPSILPNLVLSEALEITKIYSVAGSLPPDSGLVCSRPFRSPHHTASGAALVGGGAWPRPGEISLAHRGVLFLDEFTEFPRPVLDNLRQPLEDGIVAISRAAGQLIFPAKFMLVAAMNPCQCGYFGDQEKNCICSPPQIMAYRKRISGPILDRIDIHVEVPRLEFEKLDTLNSGESSALIRQRVEQARQKQIARFNDLKYVANAEMSSAATRRYCQLDDEARALMRTAVLQYDLSARAYFRILKLARTIADLANCEALKIEHLAEALQYRPKA